MLNRLAATSFALMLALSAYACGGDDDDGGTTPDSGGGGGTPDAAAGAPDGSGVATPTPDDNDGGWVLFEHITYSNNFAAAKGLPPGGNILRAMAHFYNSKNPQRDEFPTVHKCNNLFQTHGWPLGYHGNQMDAQYVDVGDLTVKGKNAAGADVTIDVPKGDPAIPDNWAQPHDIYYERIEPNGDNFILRDSQFTVEMSGSADYPPTTYDNIAYMPGGIGLHDPDLNDDTFTVSSARDTTIQWDWTPPPNQPADVPTLLSAVVLGNPEGTPIMFCVGLAEEASYTFTADDIAQFREALGATPGQPALGFMLRNYTAHTIGWFNNGDGDLPYDPANKRRIDFITVSCSVGLINAVDN